MASINARIAKELNVQTAQVAAAVDLLGEGATVPFIARYRKEKTGGLDDTQLRKLEERLGYLTRAGRSARHGPQEHHRARQADAGAATRHSTPPTARSNWKISTRPSSRSGEPRPRSRAKRDSSRWPMRCSRTRRSIRRWRPRSIVECRKRRRRRQGRARWRAFHSDRAHRREREARRRPARMAVGDGALRSKVLKGKETEGAKFSDYFDFRQAMIARCRRIARWRFCAAATKAFLDLDLDVDVRARPAAPGRTARSCRRSTSPTVAAPRTAG